MSMFRRLMRAVGATFATLFVFLAMPAGLYYFGPNPWPKFVAFANDPMMRDDGSLLLALITVVAWVSWAYFILGLLIEIIGRIFGRSPRIPGLGPAQMLAGLILAAITTTSVVSTIASSRAAASPHSATPRPAVVVASALHAQSDEATQIAAAPVAQEKYVTHVVQRGETVLDLAERYYHHPDAFTRILDANIGLPQPGGKALQPSEIKVLPGWTLRIPSPEIDPAASPGSAASGPLSLAAETSASTVYQIERGDYLWSVAQRFLGDGERYAEIAECNPDLIADPDLIEPGWQLTLPADAHDSGARPHATGDTITPPTENDSPAVTVPPVTAQPPADTATPSVPPANQPTPPAQTPVTAAPSTDGSPSVADDVAAHPEDDVHPQDPAAHVGLPSGGWITTGLAIALTTSLLLGEVNRRRKRKAQFPIRISHTPAATSSSDNLRTITNAGLTALHGQLDTTETAAGCEPDTPSSVAITSSGTEVGLHDTLTGLTVLTGPGAPSAARAIIAAALSSSIRHWGKNQAELITDTTTISGLLDGTAWPQQAERLTVTADAEAAVDVLEHEVVYRTGYLDMYGTDSISALHDDPERDPLELCVWVGTADPHTAPRIVQAARQGQRLGIDVFILGEIPGQPVVDVAEDGTLTVAAEHTTHPLLDGGRIATLNPADLDDALAILAAASYQPENERVAGDEPAYDIDDPAIINGSNDIAWEASESADIGIADLEQLAPLRDQAAPVTLRVLGVPSMSTAVSEHINFGRSYAYPILAMLAAYPHGRTMEQLVVGAGIDQRHVEPGKYQDAMQRQKADRAYAKVTINAIRSAIKAAGGRDGKVHLRHEGDLYRLDAGTVEVDLWRMHACLAEANCATDDETTIAALERAVACYHGDFAEGIYQDWATDHANVYRSQVFDAYSKLVEHLEAEQPDRALACLRAAMEVEPINESLYQTTMRIQARLGRLDAVERTMAILHDRLAAWNVGTEPDPVTQRVYARAAKPID